MIEALVKVRQAGVVEAHQLEDRRVKVGDVASVLDRVEPQFVGGADGLAPLDARAGEPHRETVRIMIAAGLVDPLAGRRPAELAAPNDQRLVPQTRPFQVGEECGDGLIGLTGVRGVVFDAIGMAVPGILEVAAA